MSTLLDETRWLETKLNMKPGPRDGKIIGHTSTGKPIYDKHSHPEHKSLKSSELEHLMFHAYEESKHHASELRKHPPGSADHEHHRSRMLHHQTVYKHVGKFWRSAWSREKKKPSTTNR